MKRLTKAKVKEIKQEVELLLSTDLDGYRQILKEYTTYDTLPTIFTLKTNLKRFNELIDYYYASYHHNVSIVLYSITEYLKHKIKSIEQE